MDNFRPGARCAAGKLLSSNSQTPGSPPFFVGLQDRSWKYRGPRQRSQTPKLPEVRHFLLAFRPVLGRTGRAGISSTDLIWRMAELRQNISPGLLTNDAAPSITRTCSSTCSPKRKENVHFLVLLIPIKILLLVLILQFLFGG